MPAANPKQRKKKIWYNTGMDHYLSQIAPSMMKQFMEANTLRSSNQLQKEQEKAGKTDKEKKAGENGDMEVDAGSMTMTDDLFNTNTGSLSYEGFSNARTWQEQQEELNRRHKEEKHDDESQEQNLQNSIADATIHGPEHNVHLPETEETAILMPIQIKNDDIKQELSCSKTSFDSEVAVIEQGSSDIIPTQDNSQPLYPNLGSFQNQENEDENLLSFVPQTIEDRLSYILINHIIWSHNIVLKEKLARLLVVAGERFLTRCHDFGVKIVLIPEGISLASLGFGNLPSELEGIRAAYLPQHKTCIIGEEHVDSFTTSQFNLPIYLMAHAFDHAMGNDSFASGKSPAVLASFTACRLEKDRHQFLDSYSSLSPVHYFAVAVTAYFTKQADDDSTYKPYGLWTCKDLMECDPSLYQYLKHLFNKGK